MRYDIEFKKKSEVQFNGVEKLSNSWMVSYRNDIDKEFTTRYEKIKNEFNKLMDDVYWNNLLYDKDLCEIKFKPVINNIYHLYIRTDDKYFLSIISPEEWKSNNYIESFKFEHNGKWIKIKK